MASTSGGSADLPSGPTLCVASERFGFICLLIAKNASSTLREVFGREDYDSHEAHYTSLEPQLRARGFTIAPLRDPVSRLLSAYQEISLRFELGALSDAGRKFFRMDDTRERFDTFLAELDDAGWDPHIRPQVSYLSGVRIDSFIRVERLQEGIEDVFRRLDLPPCPTLPVRRSRKERSEIEGYKRFLVSPNDLDDRARSTIARVYEADFRLYSKLFRGG